MSGSPQDIERRAVDSPRRRPSRLLHGTALASPLARRIVALNLSCLALLAAAYLVVPLEWGSRAIAPSEATRAEARELATAIGESLPSAGRPGPGTFDRHAFPPDHTATLYGPDGAAVAARGPAAESPAGTGGNTGASEAQVSSLADPRAMSGAAAAPILAADGTLAGTLVLRGPAGSATRWRTSPLEVAQLSILALLVGLGASLALAARVATPLATLATAAEAGRDANTRRLDFGRIRIPDLSARGDEIGRLSGALRGLLAELYARIETNEQFASEVAHEVKNPLASLHSAVGTLRRDPEPDTRARLLDVAEHDLRRLDRLMSDISDASRLDRDLIRGEEGPVDLRILLSALVEGLAAEADAADIALDTDFPDGPSPGGPIPEGPIIVQGIEARLAQVFTNLVTNALSFSTEGDTVRIVVRKAGNAVRVAVEDTGPGLPESALTAVFDRFYSERTHQAFGEHSGLGLAVAKQIVEVHGGSIRAENIHPTAADPLSEPCGARFTVILPL